jgi:pimeloyl-ACP methyl ester carboxylesterase
VAPGLETVELNPAPGVSIAVEIMAGTPPAYVYMHGLSSARTGEKSDRLLERAQRRGRGFARFDFRGHGESSGSATDITLTELMEDTTAVLDRAGPSLLVGSSLGALVAAWTAARRPDLVLGLAMLAPALGFLPEIARSRQQGQPIRLRDSVGDDLIFSQRAIEDAMSYDEARLPAQLSMPIFIVHGQLDDSVPFQLSQRFFDALPNKKKDLWLVPEGGHRLNNLIDEIYDRMEALMG